MFQVIVIGIGISSPYLILAAHAPLSEYRLIRQYVGTNAIFQIFSKQGFSATGACAKKRDNTVHFQ